MAGTDDQHQQTSSVTVAECANLCLQSFQQCLNQAAAIHPRELTLVEDQLARFSLWGSNIKVFVSDRASLDHRLRAAPEVRDAVVAVLEALDYRLRECFQILGTLRPANEGSTPTIDDRLENAFREILNEVSLLHKFSNTIRRASKETQSDAAVAEFKIGDDEGNDAAPFLFAMFTNHVRDRFPGATDTIQHRLASTMLQRRKRVLYRRAKYGRYDKQSRREPQQSTIIQPQGPPAIKPTIDRSREQDSSETIASKENTRNTAKSVAVTATTLSPQNFQKASAPSVAASKSVAISHHQELRFPPAPCGNVRRKYRMLKQKREKEHQGDLSLFDTETESLAPRQLTVFLGKKYERILASDWEECLQAVPELICPYCFVALPTRDVVDEAKWRRHIMRDLDPYVCMFEECTSPNHLYKHTSEWLKHMRQHSLRWRCTSKSHGEFVCNTVDEYFAHMKTQHTVKLTDPQLKVLASKNGRAVGPMFRSCPLCGIEPEEVDSISMEVHLIGHLHNFALKSLPSYEEDISDLHDSDSETNISVMSSVETRSTIRDFQLELNNNTGNKPAEWAEVSSDSEGDTYETLSRPVSNTGNDDPLSSSCTETEMVENITANHYNMVDVDLSSATRLSEWGFIRDIMGLDLEVNDPVRVFDRATRLKSRKSVIRMDPDCAICHAPATQNCDCESRAVDAAIQEAEVRMMTDMYSEIRGWVAMHAVELVRDQHANSTTQNDEAENQHLHGREVAIENSDRRDDAFLQQVPPEPKTSLDPPGFTPSWYPHHYPSRGRIVEHVDHDEDGLEGVEKKYSEGDKPLDNKGEDEEDEDPLRSTLEYFYSLVKLTVPGDQHPAVMAPPLGPSHNQHERSLHPRAPSPPGTRKRIRGRIRYQHSNSSRGSSREHTSDSGSDESSLAPENRIDKLTFDKITCCGCKEEDYYEWTTDEDEAYCRHCGHTRCSDCI
ncbi:hypothetical protein F4808DRAFT_362716 [Astrocystis sublimbata]|nr:hypothetical protein F4808DRAFT_362716 [Astrocystis sublimbata]